MKVDVNLLIALGGFLVAILVLIFSNYYSNKGIQDKEHEEIREKAHGEGVRDAKLDAISTTVTRTDANVESLRKDISSTNIRLTNVEKSADKAHKRIDDIEERIGK